MCQSIYRGILSLIGFLGLARFDESKNMFIQTDNKTKKCTIKQTKRSISAQN
jgi:hypothetical protein